MNIYLMKRLKNNIKSHSGILLIIGVLLSIIALINGVELYDKVKWAMQEVNEYRYPYEYSINISGYKSLSEMRGYIADMLEGNVMIENLLVYMDDLKLYAKCEVVLSIKEDLPFPVRIISENGDVIIGSGKKDICYERENEVYIRFNGEEHVVRGYAEGGVSDILDSKMMIFYNGNIPDEIMQGGNTCELLFGTSNSDSDEQVDRLFMENKYSISAQNKPIAYVSTGDMNANINFNMILCLFSVVNCIIISEFWIMRREREIIIRKICGISSFSIFRLLYVDMLTNAFISMGIFAVIRISQMVIEGVKMDVTLRYFPMCVVFVFIVSFVLVIVPVKKAGSFRMSRGLEG